MVSGSLKSVETIAFSRKVTVNVTIRINTGVTCLSLVLLVMIMLPDSYHQSTSLLFSFTLTFTTKGQHSPLLTLAKMSPFTPSNISTVTDQRETSVNPACYGPRPASPALPQPTELPFEIHLLQFMDLSPDLARSCWARREWKGPEVLKGNILQALPCVPWDMNHPRQHQESYFSVPKQRKTEPDSPPLLYIPMRFASLTRAAVQKHLWFMLY